MLTFKKYTIADWFSFYRIAAAPFLLLLIFLDFRLLFTWFLLISFATDAIDGFLARKLKITSATGSQLDSLGDQITFTIGVIGVLIFETEFIRENLILLIIAIIPFGIQMLYAFWKYGKATAFHTYLAKISAISQAVFIIWLLFFGPVYGLFYFTIAIGIIETLEEITLIYLYDNWVAGVKGFYWAKNDERRTNLNDGSKTKFKE